MNIVHVVLGKANPNRMNGVNKVAHKLATTQVDLESNVTVVGLTNSKKNDLLKRKYSLLLFERKLHKIVEVYNYFRSIPKDTMVFFHGGFILEFYFISIFLNKLGIRYIFISHGCYNEMAMKKNYIFKKIFFFLIDRKILKKAWKVVFLGKSEYDYIDRLVSDIHKVIIHNGQDLYDIDYQFKKITNDQDFVFGFMGRLDIYHKGLDKLLQGFFNYRKNGGKGLLWIIGDGPDRKSLEKITNTLNISNAVVFWGQKHGSVKFNLLANIDIFVHTSRFEGFPMALLEACALKKPILISKETNFSYFVEKYSNGLVLKENNPNEITNLLFKFESFNSAKKLANFSKKSAELIEKEFSWKKICRQYLE